MQSDLAPAAPNRSFAPSPSVNRASAVLPYQLRWWQTGLCALGMLLVTFIAYRNSFHGPFIFDDHGTIEGNATLQHWTTALRPSPKYGLAGRPFSSLTFAVNCIISGEKVEGYHAVNLLLHFLAGLTLWGVVRRTLLTSKLFSQFGKGAFLISTAVATLWLLHPVQTEAVTYLSQRTEVLMALCYLFTLYAFLRATSSPRTKLWLGLSVFACVLGSLSKEVIVTAPFVVLLFDRVYIAATWREIWQRRNVYYAGLGLSVLIVVGITATTDHGNVGYAHGVSIWDYAMTSCKSVLLYIKLSIWPHPLILDYGTAVVRHFAEARWQIIAILGLLGAALAFFIWRPLLGFPLVIFFAILAPVSSFVPVLGQLTAEHRLYLPLATLLTLFAIGSFRFLGRSSLLLWMALGVAAGWATYRRNADYQTELSIVNDTIAKAPSNPRPWVTLGSLMETTRQIGPAIADYQQAIKIDPGYSEAHLALAARFAKNPARQEEAISEYETAIKLKPDWAPAYAALGNLFFNTPGRAAEDAIEQYSLAIRFDPSAAELHYNLANALAKSPKHTNEVLKEFDRALELNPKLADVHAARAKWLAEKTSRIDEALSEFSTALTRNPDYVAAHYNFAVLLSRQPNKTAETIAQYREVIRLNPDFVAAHYNLGLQLRKDPQTAPEAIAQFETVLKLDSSVDAARQMIIKIKRNLAEKTERK